ncbi:MAG TPA: hypothetical protein DCG57_01240 [Candidatus Riflebacteria bacterium]|nr:hypothetical protein [Candidatus Riflebacteria bacterium]
MQESLTKLSHLLRSCNGYVSHTAALYLHGLLAAPPENFVIIASCRRKASSAGLFKVTFVYHKPGRPGEHEMLDCEGQSLPVATVAQALVDMVTDCKASTELDTLARCFWTLPYDTSRIRRLAAQNGYSIEKKAVFWCLWAGRGSAGELLKGFDRRPVRLYTKNTSKLLWDGSLQVLYPACLLSPWHEKPQVQLNEKSSCWLELRQYASFVSYCQEVSWVPFPGDGREKPLALMNKYFSLELSSQITSNLINLLLQLNSPSSAGAAPARKLPELFLAWVRNSADFPECALSEITAGSRKMLASDQPELWETAFTYAGETGLISEALARLESSAALVFECGLWRGIEKLCQQADIDGIAIPFAVRILLARIFAQQNRFSESFNALQLLEEKRQRPDSEIIDISFTYGVVWRLAGRPDKARAHLKQALTLTEKLPDAYKSAAIQTVIGNAYYVEDNLEEARSSYLNAYDFYRNNAATNKLNSTQTNLGLIEFKAGDLQKAEQYLKCALSNSDMPPSGQGDFIRLLTLAKIMLAKGNILEAIKTLSTLAAQKHLVANSERSEIYATFALCYELCGLSTISGKYLRMAEDSLKSDLKPAAEFYVRLVMAQIMLLHGDFDLAANRLATLIEFATKNDIGKYETSFAVFYRSLAMKTGTDNAWQATLEEALSTLKIRPKHPFCTTARIFAYLHCHNASMDYNLDADIRSLIDCGYYDPLWIFVVEFLKNIKSASATVLLCRLKSASLPEFINNLKVRFNNAGTIFNKIQQNDIRTRYLLIKNGCHDIIEKEEYQVWQTSRPANLLKFDSLTGELSFARRTIRLKPGALLARILTQLLASFPEPIPSSLFYNLIWGGDLDTHSWSVVKTSLNRLNRVLQCIYPTIRAATNGRTACVRIIFDSPFEITL